MELVVGGNSYISVEDANEYIESTYTSDDEYRAKWESLSDSDKKVLLIRSTKALDRLKYQGRKKKINQSLQFPRVVDYGVGGIATPLYISQYYDSGLIDSGFYNDDGGIAAIADACVENALFIGYYSNVAKDMAEISFHGLVSLKAGNVTETYSKNNNVVDQVQGDIYNKKIYHILYRWLISSYHSM